MMFKRGDKVIHPQAGSKGIILGREDFDGYDYNQPSPEWELVQWEDGLRSWIGNIWIVLDNE